MESNGSFSFYEDNSLLQIDKFEDVENNEICETEFIPLKDTHFKNLAFPSHFGVFLSLISFILTSFFTFIFYNFSKTKYDLNISQEQLKFILYTFGFLISLAICVYSLSHLILSIFVLRFYKENDLNFRYIFTKTFSYLRLAMVLIVLSNLIVFFGEMKEKSIIKDETEKVVNTKEAIENSAEAVNLTSEKTRSLFTSTPLEFNENSLKDILETLGFVCMIIFVYKLIMRYLHLYIHILHFKDRIHATNSIMPMLNVLLRPFLTPHNRSLTAAARKSFDMLKNSSHESESQTQSPEKAPQIRQNRGEEGLLTPERGNLEEPEIRHSSVAIKRSQPPSTISLKKLQEKLGTTNGKLIFDILDTNDDQFIDKGEYVNTVKYLFVEKRKLKVAMSQNKRCLNKLRMVFLSIACIAIAYQKLSLLINQNELKTLLNGVFGSILTASFIFSATASDIFSSMVYIIGVRAYDVGDHIIFDKTVFIVNEIGLLYTTLIKDNKFYNCPNQKLREASVVNLRRSLYVNEGFEYSVFIKRFSLSDLKKKVSLYILRNQKSYKKDFEVKDVVFEGKDRIKFRIEIGIKTARQNIKIFNQRKDMFVMYMMNLIDELETASFET